MWCSAVQKPGCSGAECREQAERVREGEDRHQPDPEDREGDAAQRDQHHGTSTALPCRTAATMPSGTPTTTATSMPATASAAEGGTAAQISASAGCPVTTGGAEIALHRAGQEDEVLLPDRQVEAEARAQRRERLGGREVAQHVQRGIARNGPHQKEGHRDDPDQRHGQLAGATGDGKEQHQAPRSETGATFTVNRLFCTKPCTVGPCAMNSRSA
jgi:hypothetical protein